MIIEAAFFNMVMTLIRQSSEEPNEERIRGIMLEKIYEQYQLLFWDKANVFSQCKYPLGGNKWADLKIVYQNLHGIEVLGNYDIGHENWMEIKYLKDKSEEDKVKKDILRLCLFINEYQGPTRDKMRYILTVKKQDGSFCKNDTLKKLFTPGKVKYKFKFNDIYVKIDLYNYIISPSEGETPFNVLKGFSLSKIFCFEIKTKIDTVDKVFKLKSRMEAEDLEIQRKLISKIDENLS